MGAGASAERVEELRGEFLKEDTNGDGAISMDELKEWHKKEDGDAYDDAKVEAEFNKSPYGLTVVTTTGNPAAAGKGASSNFWANASFHTASFLTQGVASAGGSTQSGAEVPAACTSTAATSPAYPTTTSKAS